MGTMRDETTPRLGCSDWFMARIAGEWERAMSVSMWARIETAYQILGGNQSDKVCPDVDLGKDRLRRAVGPKTAESLTSPSCSKKTG